jgi:hypothetical protein
VKEERGVHLDLQLFPVWKEITSQSKEKREIMGREAEGVKQDHQDHKVLLANQGRLEKWECQDGW